MAITITPFAFAWIITLALWIGVYLWPVSRSGGDYNFGAAFDGMVHAIVCVIGTLLIWLVYFALKSRGWL